MARWQATVGAVLVSIALQLPFVARADSGGAGGWQWPLSPTPTVTATFHAPEAQWGPGHRGIDLLGTVGQRVLAIGNGTVSFAGMVAGRGVVVLDHGRLRSTYEPVTPQVRRGDQVTGGQVIATLAAVQSHCPPAACLHLGVRRGDVYLDPLSLLGAQQVRLKPLGGLDPAVATMDPGNAVTAGQSGRPAPTSAHVDPPAGIDVPASAAGGTAAGIAVALLVRRRRRARHRVSSPAA